MERKRFPPSHPTSHSAPLHLFTPMFLQLTYHTEAFAPRWEKFSEFRVPSLQILVVTALEDLRGAL
jgi:hypothetical protein